MDFLGIGFAEFLFIMVIAMMVFGPRRLPEIAGKAGKIVADLRNMSRGLMTEWQREINFAAELDEELKKTRQELAGVKSELTQVQKDVIKDTSEVAKAIAPPALAAQAALKSNTPSDSGSNETSSLPAKSDDLAPVDTLDTDSPADAIAPANGPQSETSAEAAPPPPKPVPAPVSRPPATATNGAAIAPAQDPEQNPETPIDEQ